jgi:DnaJ homolog subfamily C member 28
MKRWESLVDQRIREGIEQGQFDNLSGRGRPIDLSENPFEDPDWRTAHRLLRNAGFAPAWIEERKDIEADVEAARIKLVRAWTVLRNARRSENEGVATTRWEQGQSSFQLEATQLNRRIVAWNLKAPAAGFQRKRIDAEREIERIKNSG